MNATRINTTGSRLVITIGALLAALYFAPAMAETATAEAPAAPAAEASAPATAPTETPAEQTMTREKALWGLYILTRAIDMQVDLCKKNKIASGTTLGKSLATLRKKQPTILAEGKRLVDQRYGDVSGEQIESDMQAELAKLAGMPRAEIKKQCDMMAERAPRLFEIGQAAVTLYSKGKATAP